MTNERVAKTLTLNLDERHAAALDRLCESHGMTQAGMLRQALRLYQLVDDRLRKGYELALREQATGEFHALLVPELGVGGCMGDDT